MKIVLVHGWGFSPDFWEPIKNDLQAYDSITVDLGYWHSSPTPIETLPKQAIYVGHSLGLLWILKNLPHKVSGLASINGFDCFHRYTPEIILNKMKTELSVNPKRQLLAFYRQCGQKTLKIPNTYQVERLLEGLHMLSDLDLNELKENLTIPITILASENDRIVPPLMTKSIWRNHNIIWSKTGGHALPLTRSQWCSSHILNLLTQVQKSK